MAWTSPQKSGNEPRNVNKVVIKRKHTDKQEVRKADFMLEWSRKRPLVSAQKDFEPMRRQGIVPSNTMMRASDRLSCSLIPLRNAVVKSGWRGPCSVIRPSVLAPKA